MKFQLANGFLVYGQTGEGIPLLLIHGYPLSKKMWDPQVLFLADIATVITLDLRGHGESYPFEGTYSMDLLADDCYTLLNGLKITQPVLICGLSMGGYITFALYRKHPDLFAGMILTSTRAAPDSPEGKANRNAGIRNVRELGMRSIAEGMLPKVLSPISLSSKPSLVDAIMAIMLETSVNGVAGALQGMRDRPDSTPMLSQITCPTLIIHGADDQLIPVSEAKTMASHIKSSSLVVIPQAGHLVNLEQPELYNQAVRDFIKPLSHA